ncbi:amidase [Nitrospira sp. MA-1]|nr:amidase [Nitrospira sp. MA-1]
MKIGQVPYRLLVNTVGLICILFIPSNPWAFELEEATITDLQEGMRMGTYTSRSIVEMYLKRVEEIDKRGPAIRSYLEVNPDALAIADQLDQERRDEQIRGPLHGIPVLLKDSIDTADKLSTTGGSYALEGIPVPRDSFVAKQLRKAGAVVIGKANMSEWGYMRSTRASSGWSARGGQTKNPYILTRNPCGSSSGSGAAVAANLVAVAIGAEVDGSIVCPASANSIVGIKPTVGLVSRAGMIPAAPTQDTAGPLTRTVADAAIVLGALTGIDPRDPRTEESRGKSYSDYTQFLDPKGLHGARIGIARNYFGYHEKVDALINRSIEVMKQQGALIIDPANVETAGQFGNSELTVLLYEFKTSLEKYLRTRSSTGPQTIKDLMAFNENHRSLEMPYFEQEIFEMADKTGPLTEKTYLDALDRNRRLAATEGIDATIKKYELDAIVAPTYGPVMPIDLILGDHLVPPWKSQEWTPSAPAVAGYPHISVPAGYILGFRSAFPLLGGPTANQP